MSKGTRTRQHIIARAATVFNTQGFAGTSMADLTRQTGIEKGGIYNHFPSKEALALAAFDYAVTLISQRMQEVMAQEERAIDRLYAITNVFRSVIDAPLVPGGCPLMNTAIEADDTSSALRERAQETMSSWLRLIGGTVKQGIANGELRPDTDPRMVATIMVAALEGAIMLSKLYDDSLYIHRAVEHLIEYLQSLAS
ncbi:MAG: TetR/AcrR family transcriptional regulator [Chloroflexales bacterium]|nr:TetR/AcrR family transcriptional regulator [Chloroflexales bacterium]